MFIILSAKIFDRIFECHILWCHICFSEFIGSYELPCKYLFSKLVIMLPLLIENYLFNSLHSMYIKFIYKPTLFFFMFYKNVLEKNFNSFRRYIPLTLLRNVYHNTNTQILFWIIPSLTLAENTLDTILFVKSS